MIFKSEEIPNHYIEDYKTLHHDIGLVRRSNGTWDLWFGQDEISNNYKNNPYLEIVDGDIVSATEIHSLQVGIIIACLTSWNYLNRSGNPIYTEFGNESYSLLKKNKGINTQYKIKQFFIDCLSRMRRVYSVESLDVYEVNNNPFIYKVKFKVLSVTNTLVDGEFYLDVDSSKNTSVLDIDYDIPYTSVSNPLHLRCILKNEYASFIENELIYVYIKSEKDSEFKFYGVTEPTNYNGIANIVIPPNGLTSRLELMFVFKGNSLYNPCKSKIIQIQSVGYYFKKRMEDNKEVLYIEDSNGNEIDSYRFRLGELLSDYTNINNLELSDTIQLSDIIDNSENNNILEYADYEKRKIYLIPTNRYIEGTTKKYYSGYSWNSDGDGLVLTYQQNVQLNSNKPSEVHFLIDIEDNGLFEINFDDGHLYYQLDLYENEY